MRDVTRDAHAVMLAAFRGAELPAWLPDAYARGLGGICLYGDNVDPVHGLAPLARAVAALDPTAVLAADEEGGDVTRLHMATGSPSPGNAALGVVDDVTVTRTIAAGIGAELRTTGIWLDLGPCADIDSNPANPVIGTRSFGADPDLVARHTSAYVAGLADAGVAASVKHFPGHGDTTADSHIDLPRVTAERTVLDQRELVPFRAAVEAEAATIMTSHVVLEALDPVHPATLSHAVLTGLLRGELGYDGVIVTDALDMAGASAELGIDGAAVASLAAGADLLCLGPEPSDGPATLTRVVDAVVQAVTDGSLPAARLAEAADRVAALRSRWSSAVPVQAALDRLRERGEAAADAVARSVVDRLDVTPLGGPATVVRIDSGSNPAVGTTSWGDLDLPGGDRVDLTADELERTPPYTGRVLIVVRNVAGRSDVWAWIDRQIEENPETLVIDLGRPGPFSTTVERHVLHLRGSSPALVGAVAARLRGRP